ncbi:MAG TPA: GGDEF domain-containing phosphodiesterase, partial [Novosphingobium sp.]|nr:GGDEF domain-containing phosphodiesterase [Novosphingobium sp.]
LGGDEFVVVCDKSSREWVEAMGLRILTAVREPVVSAYGKIEASCSIGMAIIDDAGVAPGEALRRADLALYRSKELGRMQASFFEPAMDNALRERRALEADLRLGLSRDQLEMVYQPQVDEAGRIIAYEALVRWNHPDRGVIPPAVFVPLAEESGLIQPLGEFVLRRVFAETAAWKDKRIAINVSPLQIRLPGFVALVTRLAARAGADPARYEIELTETALLADGPVTAANFDALKRLGLTIALDDFGTGYSSLSVLQRFPVDKIKIDRAFVGCMEESAESEALVEAIIKLADALDLAVIAEGVETEEQMARLSALGCHEFQGHLTGLPISAAAIETTRLRARRIRRRA